MASVTSTDRTDRLNNENYRTWKFSMKISYVDGTCKLQEGADAVTEQAYKSKVEKALSTIALSIDPDQQIHIVDCKTAEEAWIILEQVYEPRSRQRIMQLKREFVRIRLKENEIMASYLSRMKICSDYLRAAGSEVQDEDLAYAMLTGLPDTYDALTMSLANLEDHKFTSVEIRKALLTEYERRMSKSEESNNQSEIAAYQTGKQKLQRNTKTNTAFKCFQCGKPRHIATHCRGKKMNTYTKEAREYPRNQKRSTTKRDTVALLLALHNVEFDEAWLLGSAATHHVCKNQEYFTNYRQIQSKPIETVIPETKTVVNVHQASVPESDVWHARFGHINNKSIDTLAIRGFVKGLENVKMDSEQCPGCCVGKSTKAPCKKISGRQSNEILELTHSDICGPIQVSSIGGARYFMTLIDDFSRKAEVHFLKNKNEVPQIIQQYIVKVERQKSLKVKRFRTDNGLEFCNRETKELFDSLGIKHERTCVETPQMNGVAERLNRTLMDMVRAMLKSAKLPSSFWAEATSTAVQ
uniref:uncharacterized protein LOC117611448 n=1 Tax=Osmia lignaria TaxID=473952 RepID=UPI001479776F|nr:uncharacterized protein LOC117611448 [Osmia lignaria]